MQDFSDLPKTLSAALLAKGYNRMTPVQEAVSDAALAESDLLVSAQTGSGKTHTMNQVLRGEALAAVDKWIDQARDKDGLVLDLRRNYGGNLDVGRMVVGRFLAEPTDLVFVTAQEEVTTIWPFSVELFLRVQFAPRGRRYSDATGGR